jgi:hypothetical protein
VEPEQTRTGKNKKSTGQKDKSERNKVKQSEKF